MALKSILEIDVSDAKFNAYKKAYDDYRKSLNSMPAAWRAVNAQVERGKSLFDHMVDRAVEANTQAKVAQRAQERADQISRSMAERWAGMARSSRSFASNIKDATLALLKWSSVAGVVSGLVGAGGIWGIDRIALGASAGRRSALGLGLSYGQQTAFGNVARLVDPNALLAGVAGAKFDATQRVGLLGAGLTQQEINADTGTTAVALLRNLKRLADTTDPALFGQVISARRLGQFGVGPQDLERLRNTSPQEFADVLGRVQSNRQRNEVPGDVLRKWQDLTTQLDNAGNSIFNTFVRGLAPLAPGLSKLSESVEKTISAFLSSPTLSHWIEQVDIGLEKFASYIGTPEFQKNVEDFTVGLGKIANAIVTAVTWISGADPEVAQQRSAASARVDTVRQQQAAGRSRWGTFTDIFTGQSPAAQAELLSTIRRLENSGDNAVSPKGAIGRYQIMPDTARQYGYDPSKLTDPSYNETVAKAVIADLVKRYHGNVAEVLAGYNGGPGRGDRFRDSGDNLAVLPRETQKYVAGGTGAKITIENNTGGNAVVTVNGLKN